MARKYAEEVALVEGLVKLQGFGQGVATLIGEQLSTYLGRCEANAIAANKTGRLASFGKLDKDANGTLKFAALKTAKADGNYLPCRLLIIADAAARFQKESGVDEVTYSLPNNARLLLKEMESDGTEREAKAKAESAAKAAESQKISERQELAARLLAEHDAAQEAAKVKSNGKTLVVA